MLTIRGNLNPALTRPDEHPGLSTTGLDHRTEDGGVDKDSSVAEFSEYVAACWARLVRSAVLLDCSPTEAEDVVQAALTRCLLNWAKVRRGGRPERLRPPRPDQHLHLGARHRIRERPTVDVPDLAHDDSTATYDDADAVSRSLRRLTPEQRTAVVLRYCAHLAEQQMATVLGVAPGTVKSRLSRALKLLADDPDLSDLRGTR